MRYIPEALKAKLAQRWQTIAADAAPAMHIVSTQASVNTLLAETIHGDIAAARGDVALRQKINSSEPDYVYAVCIDAGVAKIYGRKLPAEYEQTWSYLWTVGAAVDVAIEYNGTWQLTGDKNFFNLVTEELPWILWIDTGGNLYAQHWNDATTKAQLATGVSAVSVCRGWQSTIDSTQDQGLIVGYLKSAAAYYRAYCWETTGNNAWETEHSLDGLGTGLLTLQVFRTNDYRIGFVAEGASTIKWELSDRIYAGMAFRPETVNAQLQEVIFQLIPIKTSTYDQGSAGTIAASMSPMYFCLLPTDGSADLTMVATRVTTTEFKFTFNKKINNPADLQSRISISPSVTITGVTWSDTDNSLTVDFTPEIKYNVAVTISIPATIYVSYQTNEQKAPFTAVSASLAAQIVTTTYDQGGAGIIAASIPPATFSLIAVTIHRTIETETVIAGITEASVTLTPISTLPI